MSSRFLKVALGLSVALNVFGIAVGSTILVRQERIESRLESHRRQAADRPSILAVVETLDPEVRERVRASLRASALQAKPDFESARLKRRQAIALAKAGDFEPASVGRLLEESRSAEMRGRSRLEADAVEVLSTLQAQDRAALAEILTRRGRSGVKGDDRRSPAS